MSVVNKKAAKKADDEAAVLAKIATMPEPYRAMGERVHTLILRSEPALRPRLWYGCRGTRRGARFSVSSARMIST